MQSKLKTASRFLKSRRLKLTLISGLILQPELLLFASGNAGRCDYINIFTAVHS